VSYLSDREIDDDGKALITQAVRNRLNYAEALVTLTRVPVSVGKLFSGRGSLLNSADLAVLDRGIAYLQQHDKLRLTIVVNNSADDSLNQERLKNIREYLTLTAPGLANRLDVKAVSEAADLWTLSLSMSEPETKER
jgi:hypothetical protein